MNNLIFDEIKINYQLQIQTFKVILIFFNF